jgi:pimeloyl-ACP methyl ester carboxylesterase
MRRFAIVACAVALVAALTTPAMAGDVGGASRLKWAPCPAAEMSGWDCATLTVPRDYSQPERGTFDLAVVRLPATGAASQRIGSLFYNPGGPGISGLQSGAFVASAGLLPSEVRLRFDFVTWDPRGVGASSGLECNAQSYAIPATGPVDWAAEMDRVRRAQRKANLACAAKFPDVVPYIGTNNTARDLEALRAAVGDTQLTYWGLSYGTRLGYVYARMFPGHARALLLSGVVNPNSSIVNFATGYSTSIDTGIGVLFEAYPGSEGQYQRVHEYLQDQTLSLPTGRQITRWYVDFMLATFAEFEYEFPTAATMLGALDTAISATGEEKGKALALLEQFPAMDPNQAGSGATPFINCLDYADRLTPAAQDRLARNARVQAPITGWLGSSWMAPMCEGVTAKADPIPTNFGVDRSTQMLLVNATRDPYTNFGWTADMARTFRASRVVSYSGSTHGPYAFGRSDCINRYGNDYLIDLVLPPVDVTCPFVTPRPLG